jgi:hypothetical protein
MSYFEGPKTKLIYVYRINDSAHQGCLKIGEATYDGEDYFQQQSGSSKLNAAAKKRINEQTQTAGVTYDLLYTESTVHITNKGIRSFNDKAVHDILLRSGVERKVFDRVNNANEWFICDLETAKRAIAAAKDGRESLAPGDVTHDQSPIIFRPEQIKAINDTIAQFRRGNKMLWNAKMRFGKTLSALQVVKELQFVRTLILTHRPVVDAEWFKGFNKIFYDSPLYAYGSKTKGSSQQNLEERATKGKCCYIFFASMQDLRGSGTIGGKFDKNDNIFKTKWDLIIIDEAHEGTQTQLGKAVITELIKSTTKVLQLSGTPFNLFDDYTDGEIFTWDYVMEQKAKADWNLTHPGDHNPYAELPRLNIYTYDLGRLLSEYIDEDIAFNFREFFRTKADNDEVFIHEADVRAFLDLLTKHDEESMYPFANDRYREIFRHTLWMLPGVKAATAMKKLLNNHPIFGFFKVVNVAGNGDEDEENSNALQMVNDAISDNPDDTRTITLSCGRLTTGVSVKPWMGVLMLSGSFNTAASAYMQTIFRVQTPFTCNGKVKEDCYVFDFAPDRTLKVLAETAKISTKAGKQGESERRLLGEFLNFCPIISIEGSKMATYDVDHMLQQLKSVYVERVVRNGFEDGSLYNDELLKLSDIDIEKFKELKKIIGQTKAMAKSSDITVNDQGLNNEEYEEKEKIEKKAKKERTPEEQARLDELKQKKEGRDKAISILRGISIRMPLLIYGASITDEDKQLTIDNFTSLVDDQSWEEFMPKKVTKEIFGEFKSYYDKDIFAAAAKRIRAIARAADNLTIEERIERITFIFKTFRNPDKETVLTPWEVVNRHMGDCLGGYVFYQNDFKTPLLEPRYVERSNITDEVYAPNTHLLEINSKSGLYPLYLAYNVYRRRLSELTKSPETLEEHQAVWDKVLDENIYVICKTPMAKSITRRTLHGFRKARTNMWAPDDLINKIKNQPELFIKKVHDLIGNNVKINAIVGNPPYQVMDGGGTGSSAVPVYNNFVDVSKQIKPQYISMIMPAKWYSGGRGLDDFRQNMLNDTHICKLVDFVDSRECFPTVDIAGGLCYFLWNELYEGECNVININNGQKTSEFRYLNAFDTFIRDARIIQIINKVKCQTSTLFLDQKVYASKPFGLRSFDKGFPAKQGRNIRLFGSDGISYLSEKDVPQNIELASKWKVIMSKASAEHAGQTDKEGRKRIVSRLEVLPPGTICTESYLLLDTFDNEEYAVNMKNYVRTQFVRFLLASILLTQNIVRDKFRFVPIQDFTEQSDIDWSKSIADIDRQLYAKYGLTDEEITFIESMIKPL